MAGSGARLSAPGVKSRVFAPGGKRSSWFVGHSIALYTYLAVYITRRVYVCVDVSPRVYVCRAYTCICQFGARVAKQHVYMQVEANSRCIGIMCEIYVDESEAACTCMCVRVRVRSHDVPQMRTWMSDYRLARPDPQTSAFSLFVARYICEYEDIYICLYAYISSVLLLVSLSLLSSRSDKQWDIKWDVENEDVGLPPYNEVLTTRSNQSANANMTWR